MLRTSEILLHSEEQNLHGVNHPANQTIWAKRRAPLRLFSYSATMCYPFWLDYNFILSGRERVRESGPVIGAISIIYSGVAMARYKFWFDK